MISSKDDKSRRKDGLSDEKRKSLIEFNTLATAFTMLMILVNRGRVEAAQYELDSLQAIGYLCKGNAMQPNMYNWYTFANDSSMTLVFEDEYYIDYVVFTTTNENKFTNVKLLSRDQMVIQDSNTQQEIKIQSIKIFTYTFVRMQAKYLVVSPRPSNSCLYSVLVNFEVLHKPSYFTAPNSSQYQISEASYYDNNQNYNLQNINNMMNITSTAFFSISPVDTEFDVSPVAWFTVKLNKIQLVHQFIIMSGAYNGFNSVGGIWLSFRVNDDRDFIDYTENNQLKVFNSNYVYPQWFSYNLLNPFLASEIQVIADSENPLMYFTMDFRFIEPIEYEFVKPVIGLYSLMAEDFLSIKLNQSSFISGIQFDNINSLLKFCIYYKVNNELVPYRDSNLFNDQTIFTVSPEITLFPFRTSELSLSCLVWFMNISANISITVLGDHYLSADYVWLNTTFISYDAYVEYTSTRGNQKLFGDSKYLRKISLHSRLMSDHFGPNCFTQPHLCVSGFTVQLDAVAPFLSEDVTRTFYVSDKQYSNSTISDGATLAGVNAVRTWLYFNEFLLPPNADVKDFRLKIGPVTSPSSVQFPTNIYLLLIPGNENVTDYWSSCFAISLKSVIYSTFMFNGSFGETQDFKLTELLKISRNQTYGLVKGLCILLVPSDLTLTLNVKVDFNDTKLVIVYSNNVVGDVRILDSQSVTFQTNTQKFVETSNSYFFEVSFDQAYFMTGIQLWTESPIDVDLLLQAKYSDTSDAVYFTVKKIFLNRGENQYIALIGAIRAKHFRFILSNNVVIKYKFYGTENTYRTAPILSAGLGGYQKATHGNGFQIQLTDDKITATVVTQNGKYSVEMGNPLNPFTLTLVWSKQNNTLKLYNNNVLMGTGTLSENNSSANCLSFNEYLLVFADYYNNQSDLQASLSSIKLWSIPLSEDEIPFTLSKDLLFENPGSIPPPGFTYGSDCYCKNNVCPCETLETTATVEFVSRFATVTIVSEDGYMNEDQLYVDIVENVDNFSYIYFDDIFLNFRNLYLVKVYLVFNLQSFLSASCNTIVMQFLNSSGEAHVQWCISDNVNGVIVSPDLTASLTHLLKTTSFTPPLTILLKINNVVVQPKSFLRIVYETPRPGGFIHASAEQSSPDDVLTTLSFNITGACISFKFKFGGTGFVNLVIFGHGTNVKKRLAFFYRQEGQDRWVEKNLDLGYNYSVVEFVAFKNGLGIGYIAFSSFQFFQSCSIKTSGDTGIYTTQMETYSFPNPIVMVTDSYDFYSTIENVIFQQNFSSILSSFFNSYIFMTYNQQLMFQKWPMSDFTILFWFKNSTSQSIILNMAYNSGDTISIGFNSASIFITYKTIKKLVNMDNSIWHYVIVQYYKKSSHLSLHMDYKEVVYDDVSLPDDSPVVFQLANNLFCFQVYNEILFYSATKAAQFCPTKQWDFACNSRRSQCEWCNPFFGRWELFPWDYIIENKKIECIQDGFMKMFYQPFNAINNNNFVAGISNGYEVGLSTEVKMVNGFIYNGLSTTASSVTISDQSVSNFFTQCCPVFSAWIKQSCESFSEELPILTTSVVILLCKKKDSSTTTYPIMAFYNNCFYDLPGRSGLWYNFAFVINQTISFYINGILINSSCRSGSQSLQQSLSNEIKVFSVGSFPTLIDEVVITSNIDPEQFFWLQLTGYPNADKIKQTTKPFIFMFDSIQVLASDAFTPGSYLYEKTLNIVQSQITELMTSVKEVLLSEVISLHRCFSEMVCGKLNVHLKFENRTVLNYIAGLNNNFISKIYLGNNIEEVTERASILRYYSNSATYYVLQKEKSAVELSINITEDVNFPVSGIIVKYWQVNSDNAKWLFSNDPMFTYIDKLEIFQEYQVCFVIQTIRMRLYSLCVLQNKTFMTAEGEPTEYPKMNCSLNENTKTVNCNMTKISSTSWNGIPYSYNIVYRVKGNGDSCQNLSVNGTDQFINSIKFNNSINLKFSINTSDFYFVDLCIFGYATTQNGSGIGIWDKTVIHTQREAPDEAPQNFTAVINGTSIQFNWNPLENTTDAWNDYKIPGFYQLSYGLVNSSESIIFTKNNISNNQFVLTNADFCYIYKASVNAFSIAPGPKNWICLLGNLTVPNCMKPLIESVYVTGSTNASIIIQNFLPTFFRGTKTYWLFHVNITSQYYNPGPLSEEYLQKPFYYKYSIENYTGKSFKCSEDFLNYFNQKIDFLLNLEGLHPYTQYQVSVQPCNEKGCGRNSNNIGFWTYSDIPSCEPNLLQMKNLSSTSMNISWKTLNLSCANVDISQITYTLKCNQSQGLVLLNESISTTDILLSNLNKYDLLCCEVAASNINGTGPFSSKSCAFTAEDKPSIAPNCSNTIMSSYSGTLTLSMPDSQINGILIGVNVQFLSNYSRINASFLTMNITCCLQENPYSYNFTIDVSDLNNDLNISFENLLPFYVYFVQLRYFTSIGFGPWSPIYQLLTEEGLSDAPSFISNYTDNVRVIRVNWDAVPPENSHGIITSYEVCRKQLYLNYTIGPNYCFKQLNASIFEFNLTDLDRGSTHNISIAACNKAGCGKKNFIVASTLEYVAGNWSQWSLWSDCSQTCNEGLKIRSRQCTPLLKKAECSGNNISIETCELGKCSGFVLGGDGITDCNSICAAKELVCSSIYTNFYNDTSIFLNASPPIVCTNTPSGSFYSSDLDPRFNSAEGLCFGYINIPKYIPCKSQNKFIQQNMHRLCNCVFQGDIGFSEWSEWSFCTETCGETSFMIRKRQCDGNCTGISLERKKCDVPVCPVDGKWSSWGPYENCNATCGYGVYFRKRVCDNPPAVGGGTPCQGPQEDILPECGAFPCPINGGFSEWTPWSICDKPCGNGTQTSMRYCNSPVPANNGQDCVGNFTRTINCEMSPCKEIEVNLVQRTLEKWLWKMYKVDSDEAKNFTLYFKGAVQAYFNKKGLKGLKDVVVNKLEAGSIFVNYTLIFEYLHGQIVEYLDDVNSTGKLMNIAISSTLSSSKDVQCLPPYNIKMLQYTETQVSISWLRDSCNNTELWLYIYYKDTSISNSIWEWFGVPSDAQSATLSNLVPSHQYKAYMLTAVPDGNGLPSIVFSLQSSGKGPERPPAKLRTESIKSTEIYVEWSDILEQNRNGKILGYRIRYKVYLSSEPLKEVETQNGFNAFVLKNLKPFTLYYIEVYGYNLFNSSPPIFSMCKTIEDVPSILVPNIQIKDMQYVDRWSVSWDQIPAENANGVLLGYRLIYYLNYRSGEEVSGEKFKNVVEFDPFTRYYEQKNLLNYAIYNLSITGFTSAGDGPAQEYQAKTCKCAEILYVNWYVKEPFISIKSNRATGFFVKFLEDMMIQSCGSCKSYSNKISKVYFERSKFGDSPVKDSEFDLKSSINNNVDLSFPIFERNGREIAINSTFILLLQSPGIAAVVRNENNVDSIVSKVVSNVFSIWPVLLISYLIAALFGTLVWFTDQFRNPEQFVIGNAWKGPLVGFWFSFITMTTIGYGDMTPRSVLAQMISIVWFVIGMILNSIIIGFIVTNLTSVSLPSEFMLYDTKVATLEKSYENKIAIFRNARVSSVVSYDNIDKMLNDLKNKVVDMVYVDIFSLLDYQSKLEKQSLKLAFIDSKITAGYGFALSGLSTALRKDVKSYIEEKSATIISFAQSLQGRLPELAVENADETIKGLFSQKSSTYKKSLIYLGILIAGMIILGLLIGLRRHRANGKIKEKTSAKIVLDELVSGFHEQFSTVAEEIATTNEQEYVTLYEVKSKYTNKIKHLEIIETNNLIASHQKSIRKR